MDVVVASEARLYRRADGKIVAPDETSAYPFWTRYLEVFDRVVVLARVFEPSPRAVHEVTGRGVDVAPLPAYGSLQEYVLSYPRLRRASRCACFDDCAYVARLPGAVGGLLAAEARRLRHPYAAEIVGDPWEVFRSGSVDHAIRPLLRVYFAASLRRQSRRAAAVAYVSSVSLPQRYPAAPDAPTAYYSSIDLGDEAYLPPPSELDQVSETTAHLVSVGSLEQRYKGIDTVLHAVAHCRSRGRKLRLVVLGDGRYRPELEQLAQSLGIGDAVDFRGKVSSQAVRSHLDAAHLFVLPSRTEGLPRAAIEAMARCVPVIGSTAGGFPELLDPDDMVPPDRPISLANKIIETLASTGRRHDMVMRNYERARAYRREELRARRTAFYREVRALAQDSR